VLSLPDTSYLTMVDRPVSTTHSFPLVEREAASRRNAGNGVSANISLEMEGADVDLGDRLVVPDTQSVYSLIILECSQRAGTVFSLPIRRKQCSGVDVGL